VTLRGRLVLTLLVLATAGMLVLGAVTYASQRDFLLERVDEQTRSAVPALERELGLGRGGRRGPPGFDRGGPRRDGGSLPSGTYGELRGPGGEPLASTVIAFGDEPPARPRLPAVLRPGELRTVGAQEGGAQFRVRALEAPSGAQLVVAVPLDDVEETLDRLLVVLAVVTLGVLVLLGLLADRLVRLGLRPLDRITATAEQIAGGRLDHRVPGPDPRTEAGRLGLAMNNMLERLQAAFAQREASERRLRTFLADASHELRTPLASIRGYAELHRMGAAEDLDRTMGRIEDESARMGVLVEDLLKLARLDELREPVRRPVALADLVDDAVRDARATDPGRPIEGLVDGEPVAEADPDAVRQVLANLVRNALVHTPPGTPVTVAAREEGDDAVLEVRDRGPGLPAGARDQVFERFWRGEGPGRERGRAGAGLGLSIVAGLVAAHGGTVLAEDAPGGGARFVVRLPRVV
jgi:two-component system, OmpR family, sensor kinase